MYVIYCSTIRFILHLRPGVGTSENFFGSDRDRIGRLNFFLDRIGIGSVASNFFWIGSGSDRSAQNVFGSDRDRIGWLKKNWIGSGSDRNWIGFHEKSISAHC